MILFFLERRGISRESKNLYSGSSGLLNISNFSSQIEKSKITNRNSRVNSRTKLNNNQSRRGDSKSFIDQHNTNTHLQSNQMSKRNVPQKEDALLKKFKLNMPSDLVYVNQNNHGVYENNKINNVLNNRVNFNNMRNNIMNINENNNFVDKNRKEVSTQYKSYKPLTSSKIEETSATNQKSLAFSFLNQFVNRTKMF